MLNSNNNEMLKIAIRRMQIRTAMRYHLTLIRMAIIKKPTSNKCWRGCGEKVILLQCWWESKLVQPLWKILWRLLKKLKIDSPHDPAIPFLGIYLEKTLIWKDTCTPVFIAALTIYNSQDTGTTICPLRDEWIRRMWRRYMWWNTLSRKRDGNNVTSSNMNGHRGGQTKWRSQPGKDKYHMMSLIHGLWIWCKWAYLPNRNRFTDIGKLIVTKEEMG